MPRTFARRSQSICATSCRLRVRRRVAGQARCLLLAHLVDPRDSSVGPYRRVTGPPREIGKAAAHEA
jgi:hypothetical protein